MKGGIHAWLIALLLAGCAQVEGWIDDKGNVYECDSDAYAPVELCTELTADELAAELSSAWASPTTCWSTSRLWPALTGCWYHCTNERGCNATGSCWCPMGSGS